ncbi:hypothetical protein B484DRAFT_480581 [Ochromonadaceae sp. CCMP2298]|nr:hypothetical protein B484DRAFT_480581 [Ochromonadaceae sp. CCMP2298]
MESSTINCMSFNVDASIMTLSTANEFATFHSVGVERIAREERLGGMRVVEVLNRSSLLVLIPSGAKPGTSPRRLKLWNSQTGSLVFEMAFESTVQNCAVNKSVLVAGIEGALHLFQLATVNELIRLPARSSTVFALSAAETVYPLLAYCEAAGGSDTASAASAVGSVRLFDCAELRALGSIQAHRGEVAQLAFSASGLLLASTSATGSLVRVFSMPSGACLYVLRHSLPQLLPIAAAAAAAAAAAHEATGTGTGAAVGGTAPRTSGGSSYSVPASSSSAVTSLCFCPEGRYLLSEGRRQSDAKERTSQDSGSGDAASQWEEAEEEQEEEDDEDGFCRVDGAEVLAAAAADSRAVQSGGSKGGRGVRDKCGAAHSERGASDGDLQQQVDQGLRQLTAAAGSAGAEVQRHWLQIRNALFRPESGSADAGIDATLGAGVRAEVDGSTAEAVGGGGSNSRSSSRGSGGAATTAGGQAFDFNYGGLVTAVRDLSLSSIAALSLGGAQDLSGPHAGLPTEAPALHARLLLPTASPASSSTPAPAWAPAGSAAATDGSDGSSAQSSSSSPRQRRNSRGEGGGSSSGGSAFYCALTYGDGGAQVCPDAADGAPLVGDSMMPPPARALSLVVVAANGLYRRYDLGCLQRRVADSGGTVTTLDGLLVEECALLE